MKIEQLKNKVRKELEIIHGKGQNGFFYCVIREKKYPYCSSLAYGKTEEEAETNAWELRKKILQEN